MGYSFTILDEGDLDSEAAYFGVSGGWWSFLCDRMLAFRMLNTSVEGDDGPPGRLPDQIPDVWEPSPVTGIPLFKISCNTHEVVTPAEVAKALGVYDTWPEGLEPCPVVSSLAVVYPSAFAEVPGISCERVRAIRGLPEALWQEWIAFMRRAANHGGFLVT
jgi:hypothetical protein